MAKVLTEMPTQTRVAARKYDWESILDGTPRAFTAGDDFDSKVESFVSMTRTQATQRGLKVSIISMDDDTVAVQAYQPDDESDE